jgi:hypothetical protein
VWLEGSPDDSSLKKVLPSAPRDLLFSGTALDRSACNVSMLPSAACDATTFMSSKRDTCSSVSEVLRDAEGGSDRSMGAEYLALCTNGVFIFVEDDEPRPPEEACFACCDRPASCTGAAGDSALYSLLSLARMLLLLCGRFCELDCLVTELDSEVVKEMARCGGNMLEEVGGVLARTSANPMASSRFMDTSTSDSCMRADVLTGHRCSMSGEGGNGDADALGGGKRRGLLVRAGADHACASCMLPLECSRGAWIIEQVPGNDACDACTACVSNKLIVVTPVHARGTAGTPPVLEPAFGEGISPPLR